MSTYEERREAWIRAMNIVTSDLWATQRIQPDVWAAIEAIMGPDFTAKVLAVDEAYKACHG